MKWAKVSKGLVHHVWPRFKNGQWHEMPDCYRGLNGKPVPECIVQVPDDVQPGWVWDGEKYAKRVKKPIKQSHSDMLEVIAEKLGMSYDELHNEIMKRKKARRAAKKDR